MGIFFIQASYGSASDEESGPEEECHLGLQNEIREEFIEPNPKKLILEVSLPSNAKKGDQYNFNKEVTHRNGKKTIIKFTFTKDEVSGSVRTLKSPFYCWQISSKPFFRAKNFYFDIHGNFMQTDIHFDIMSKYMDIMLEGKPPPNIEYSLKVSETPFQIKDLSE